MRLSFCRGNLACFHQRLEPPQVLLHQELRIFAHCFGDCTAERSGWRHVARFRLDQSSAISNCSLKTHGAFNVQLGTRQRSPRDKLIGFVTNNLCIPLHANAEGAKCPPSVLVIIDLGNGIQVTHKNWQVLEPAPEVVRLFWTAIQDRPTKMAGYLCHNPILTWYETRA